MEILTLFSILFILLCSIRILRRKTHRNNLPPQPAGAWPIIGHLSLLVGDPNRHVTLGNLADKYGDVFMIKTGAYASIVVSSWELAKECFTVNDKTFADRPTLVVGELMGYNSAMLGFIPYGAFWRQMRKIATLELLSNHRIQALRPIRESEIRSAVKDLAAAVAKLNGAPIVKMKEWFGDIVMNVIFRVILGKRFGDRVGGGGGEWRAATMRWFATAGKAAVGDALPFLRGLDLGGTEREMKETAREFDGIVQGWLDERKRERKVGKKKKKKEEEDFMDVMISVLEESKEISSHDADSINKAMCLGFIIAATDTTKFTLSWALALLLKNPSTLKKAQQELDANIGRQRNIQEPDTNNLLYLQAIIKETLRLHPAAALSVPHQSMEDCTVGGYLVPKGTRLLVNLWKMHRDPRVWVEPNEFRPERFLTTHKHVDVRGQNFELLPFGSGRRMCPGAGFSLQVMVLILANLLHGFDVCVPFGKEVDLDEGFSVTNQENVLLEVQLSPRLPTHLYQ